MCHFSGANVALELAFFSVVFFRIVRDICLEWEWEWGGGAQKLKTPRGPAMCNVVVALMPHAPQGRPGVC